jgi:hypothetical protein
MEKYINPCNKISSNVYVIFVSYRKKFIQYFIMFKIFIHCSFDLIFKERLYNDIQLIQSHILKMLTNVIIIHFQKLCENIS